MLVGAEGYGAARGLAEGSLEHLAHALRLNGLLELQHVVASAGEVDALAEAAHGEAADEHHRDDCPCDERHLVLAHEVDFRVLQHVARYGGGERQVEPLVALELVLVDHAGHVDGGEERAAQTDDERGGEAADGACAEDEQYDAGDD